MEGFLLNVTAYHGEPVTAVIVPTRPSCSRSLPIAGKFIINNPHDDNVRDMTYASTDVLNRPGGESDYTVDRLIEDFQTKHTCKVNYDNPVELNGFQVFEFDIFEPAWAGPEKAQEIIEALVDCLVDWIEGYPQGR